MNKILGQVDKKFDPFDEYLNYIEKHRSSIVFSKDGDEQDDFLRISEETLILYKDVYTGILSKIKLIRGLHDVHIEPWYDDTLIILLLNEKSKSSIILRISNDKPILVNLSYRDFKDSQNYERRFVKMEMRIHDEVSIPIFESFVKQFCRIM